MKNLKTQLISYLGEDEFRRIIQEDVLSIFPYSGDNTDFNKRYHNLMITFSKINFGSNSDITKYYQWVATLHFICNIPLEAFQLEKSDPLIKKLRFNRRGWKKVLHFDPTDKNSKENYLDVSTEFLTFIRKKLEVYDLLIRWKHATKADRFRNYKVHKYIFEEIEAKITASHGRIGYVRYLAVPHSKMLDWNSDPDLVVKAALLNAPIVLLKHMARFLTKNTFLNSNVHLNANEEELSSGFYALPFAQYQTHFASIDYGKFSLTEEFKFDKDSCIPHSLKLEDFGHAKKRFANDNRSKIIALNDHLANRSELRITLSKFSQMMDILQNESNDLAAAHAYLYEKMKTIPEHVMLNSDTNKYGI